MEGAERGNGGTNEADGSPVAIAVTTGIAIRVVLMAAAWLMRGTAPFLVPDSWSYLLPATSLARNLTFTNVTGAPDLFRTPGYPLLLAPGVLLHAPVLCALAVNLLCVAGIVLLTYDLARRLTSERTARVCALVAAVEPTLMTWSMKVMPEAAFTLCLLLFARAVIEAVGGRQWAVGGGGSAVPGFIHHQPPAANRQLLLAALPLCAAVYLKPIAYPLLLAVIVLAFLARPRREAALFALACVACIAPWHLRNLHVADYGGFSTVMERAAYLSAGASVAAQRAHVSHAEMRTRMLGRADATTPDVIRREGWSLIRSDPFGYAITHVKGMLRTLFDPGAVEYLRMFGIYKEGAAATARGSGVMALVRAYPLEVALSLLLAAVLLPLVVLPAIAVVRFRRDPRVLLLALIAVYLVFAGGGIPGYHRFRVPAVPFLILLSACVDYTARNAIFGGRRLSHLRLSGDRDDLRRVAGDRSA